MHCRIASNGVEARAKMDETTSRKAWVLLSRSLIPASFLPPESKLYGFFAFGFYTVRTPSDIKC